MHDPLAVAGGQQRVVLSVDDGDQVPQVVAAPRGLRQEQINTLITGPTAPYQAILKGREAQP